MLGLTNLKLGLGLGALIFVALVAFGIKVAINKIDRQGQQIAQLQTDLRTEKAARQADVAGLTTLSRGVVAASSARALDDKILAETIDAQHPQPASPGLSHFLDGLRGAPGAAGPAADAAGGAHQPAAAGAAGTRH